VSHVPPQAEAAAHQPACQRRRGFGEQAAAGGLLDQAPLIGARRSARTSGRPSPGPSGLISRQGAAAFAAEARELGITGATATSRGLVGGVTLSLAALRDYHSIVLKSEVSNSRYTRTQAWLAGILRLAGLSDILSRVVITMWDQLCTLIC